MTEFARGSLLGQTEIAVQASPIVIYQSAELETEVMAIFAAPNGDCVINVFHSPQPSGVFTKAEMLFQEFPVDAVFQGPIAAAQSMGGGIVLESGHRLAVELVSGIAVSISVYGVTPTLLAVR